jgi:DNA topoisomerase I
MRLRTSDPSAAGLRRERRGRGFRYLDTSGAVIDDAAQVARIRSLVIPPAWREVWICPWSSGHIQAVGTDDAGRRQYLYHPRFRERQEQAKHEHVLEVAAGLPALRERVADSLDARGLGRERVLACAVRLLDLGFFRIGSDVYAQRNGSFGLTTMLREHVTCRSGEIVFEYPAKSGKQQFRALSAHVRRRINQVVSRTAPTSQARRQPQHSGAYLIPARTHTVSLARTP